MDEFYWNIQVLPTKYTSRQNINNTHIGRGLRDITQQLRSLGLLPERNKRRRTSSNDVNSGSEEEGTNEVAPPPKRGKKKGKYSRLAMWCCNTVSLQVATTLYKYLVKIKQFMCRTHKFFPM